MWKEHVTLHLHVKNSVQLHQAEAWTVSFFFDIATKKNKAGFLPWNFVWKSNSFHGRRKWSRHQRLVGVLGDKNWKLREPTRDRNVRKEQWTELYNQKSDEEFSEKMRINHTKFNLLLNTLWAGLNTNQLCAGANITR